MGTYGPVEYEEPIEVLKLEHFSIADTFLYNNIMVVIIILNEYRLKVSTTLSEVSSIFMSLFGQYALKNINDFT